MAVSQLGLAAAQGGVTYLWSVRVSRASVVRLVPVPGCSAVFKEQLPKNPEKGASNFLPVFEREGLRYLRQQLVVEA